MTRMPRAAVAGLLLAAVIAVVAIVGGGDGDGYRVKVVLANANGVEKDFDVKIDGVKAGTVAKVDLDGRDHAVLTLDLEKEAGAIGTGATAYARPANLLGEKYIDLRPGDTRRPQPSGSVIPLSRTGTPLELDDVLNTLDGGTRARLRILINEAGLGLGGRGADFNALLATLPGGIDQTRRVLDQVNSENARLRRTISAADRVAASVAGGKDDLQRVVTDAAGALEVVASRRKELGATIASAPGALGELNGTLADLGQTAGALIPTGRALRATAPPLQQVLRTLPSFADDASATLHEAETLAPALSRLGRQATPHVRRIDTTAKRLATFSRDLSPVVRGLSRGVLRDAINFMNGWSQVVARSDGLGHIFHVRAVVDQELLTNALSRYTSGLAPTARRRKPATAPAAAPPAEAAPAAAPKPARPVLPQLPIVKDVVDAVGGAVQGALDPLLGKLGIRGGHDAAPRQTEGADALRLFDYLFGS